MVARQWNDRRAERRSAVKTAATDNIAADVAAATGCQKPKLGGPAKALRRVDQTLLPNFYLHNSKIDVEAIARFA